MYRKSLEGTWQLTIDPQSAAPSAPISGTLPGCNYLDLMAAGMEDPFYGTNENTATEKGHHDHSYRRKFVVSTEELACAHLEFVGDGIDTVARLLINGQEAGYMNNFHRIWRFDIKNLVCEGENEIELRFRDPYAYVKEQQAKDTHLTKPSQDKSYIRKPPCHFGWDWGPKLAPTGVARSIMIEAYDNRILESRITQKHEEGKVKKKDMKAVSIAIDGPAGAGKSSIAKRVAKTLGYIYVDTGALYRTVGLAASERQIEPVASAEVDDMLAEIKVELTFNEQGEQIVLLDGRNVSWEIRTPEASIMSSKISAVPAVRAYLLDLQRDMAKNHDVIMDGRDIGTVVLPDAQVKIFLTASPEARAERRFKELKDREMDVRYEDVLNDVITRDYNDSHRDIAPLKPAEDSIVVDTTTLDFEQSVEKIISVIKENR